jgi:protein TonB
MLRRVPFSRNALIATGVVLIHLGGLWALQTGLLRRTAEVLIPANILTEFLEPPAPTVAPQRVPTTPKISIKPTPIETLTPLPTVVALPSPNAPTAVSAPTAALPPLSESGAGNKSSKVELPSSDAQYLQNPAPPYPVMSKRLGEQGTVILHVLIGTEGMAQKAELKQSSGYERLDQVALKTVKDWRFVPGKRGGIPEAMWFDLPIKFELK